MVKDALWISFGRVYSCLWEPVVRSFLRRTAPCTLALMALASLKTKPIGAPRASLRQEYTLLMIVEIRTAQFSSFFFFCFRNYLIALHNALSTRRESSLVWVLSNRGVVHLYFYILFKSALKPWRSK